MTNWKQLADDYWIEVCKLVKAKGFDEKQTEIDAKELRSRQEGIKGGFKYLYLHAPPEQTAEALMAWQAPKTKEEMKQSLIDAGIIDEHGELMPYYRQPERKPRKKKPSKTQARNELLNEVSSLLLDYADFIRDNYDTELTERLNKAIVKIAEWQEVLNKRKSTETNDGI